MLFFKILIIKWGDEKLDVHVLKLTVNSDYLWVNKIINYFLFIYVFYSKKIYIILNFKI